MQTPTAPGALPPQVRAHHRAASVWVSTELEGSSGLGMRGEVGGLELTQVGGECGTTPEGKLQAPSTFSLIPSDFTYATQIQR